MLKKRFNPRTRVGCDTGRLSMSARGTGFNPRTRVGCDKGRWTVFGSNEVSIHAPAWGATKGGVLLIFKKLFQSTHPRGVRLSIGILGNGFSSFNPRTRVGCDQETASDTAYTWGFNPRTRVGCD